MNTEEIMALYRTNIYFIVHSDSERVDRSDKSKGSARLGSAVTYATLPPTDIPGPLIRVKFSLGWEIFFYLSLVLHQNR